MQCLHPFCFYIRLSKKILTPQSVYMNSKILLPLFFVAISYGASAQSRSYQALKNNFKGQPDVHSFSVNGWLGRMILNVAGEHEFREAIKELNHVRLMVIPHAQFVNHNLSVKGFKTLLNKDQFEELAEVRDKGELVSVYMQEGKEKTNNRYMILIEGSSDVVAIELTGYMDASKLVYSENEVAIK